MALLKITLNIADPDHAILAVRVATAFASRDDLPRSRPQQCMIFAYSDAGKRAEVLFGVWETAEHVCVREM